jgi:predicted transposase YbfD/YdcC
VVTADAMHTQKDIANYLVDEKKADYLFTVKDNQSTLLEDIKSLDLKKTPNRISPPSTKGRERWNVIIVAMCLIL